MSHSRRLAFAFAVPSLALMLAGTLPAVAADVAFFPLPSGAYPHDVAPAPDGAVWYSDQPHGLLWFTGQSGVYGRVDPASGKVDAWRAPKGRGPYGITATTSGVWYASLA